MCVCVAVNSHACYICIVNDITDSNTCLFSVSVFSFYFGTVCGSRCVCVCVAVNSPACYMWIVNDITDFNTCLFFVPGFFVLLYFGIVCVRWCVSMFV